MRTMGATMVMGTALAGVLLASTALAQVPVAELAKPPAEARHFIIQSTGGKHGDSWAWTAADGTVMGRESMVLRGQVWEVESATKVGPDGMPAAVTVRGFSPQGDAGETFAVAGGKASWKSQIDAGSAAYGAPAFYTTMGGPMGLNAQLVEAILASPDKSLALLPGGRATAKPLTTIEVGEGAAKHTLTAWAISGLGTTPVPIWTDAAGKFFGVTFGMGWLPVGYEKDMARMEAAQVKALAADAPARVKALLKTPDGPVAFTHVRLYDADAGIFRPDQTVVVDKGLIVRVGAAAKTPIGKAMIIDGAGKTLVPGLWDSHMHVGDDFTGTQELSLGVTSVRDPGNNDVQTIERARRRAAGELLMPNVYASSLIDGKGPNTAQVANVVTSEVEAIAAVKKAKAGGFIGVKFYGTLDPKWLKPAIAKAHRLGLHVHGHVPQGIRPMDAIAAGYDEITHINWVMMQAMPDSVIAASNGIMRFEGPGRYARQVDLDAEPMKTMVATMAKKKIVSDPTLVTFEGLYVPDNGDLSPAYAPFAGTMPPTTERGFRSGGFAVPKDLTRADYRASFAKMKALAVKMQRAGVPIVAGTDGSGLEIIRELELYVEAGMTPGEALATATINPARLVGKAATTGSIKVGKVADMVLVEGNPSVRIDDLRQTRTVMLGGKLLDADALRAAAGFSGRPK
ncbi:amidohydrolase family protein [Sandarakinorhabdus sp. DWP1-3-1]|uniref:amidohydrolase family protein n=1 Tax=Sandarakinorhabdus sp. DWP1-3-1 TaxID=2804627 RepID=UPI003CE70AA2